MSHTLRKINLGNTALAEVIIVDYAAGGEAFTLAELGLTGGVQSIVFLKTYDANPNIQPRLVGNKVQLLDLTQPDGTMPEITPQVGINFPLVALVHGQ